MARDYRSSDEMTDEEKRKALQSMVELKRKSDTAAGRGPARNETALLPAEPQEEEGLWPISEKTSQEIVGSLPRPLRRAAYWIGDRLLELQNPSMVSAAPPRGALLGMGRPPSPPSPNPTKQADMEAVAAATRAAALAHHAGEAPSGQAENQAKPAPSSDVNRPPTGTGPGAVAETPAKAAAAIGPSPNFVRLRDGRVVMGNNLEPYRQAGGSNISFQEAMATQGLGAPQAARFMRGAAGGGAPGAPARAFRDTSKDSRYAGAPYSVQVRALADEGPDLSEEGGVGFGLGAPGSGGPIQGYRKLSGLEQAIERRAWLERRADVEQAREVRRAELERRARLAEMDPLEIARIQAQGRMGGDIARVELDLRARQAALDQYRGMSAQIEKAQAALSAAAPGSPEALQLKDYIDSLVLSRRELANLTLGRYLANPQRGGDLEALMAAMVAGGAGAGSPPAGAR